MKAVSTTISMDERSWSQWMKIMKSLWIRVATGIINHTVVSMDQRHQGTIA
jgi:hypothetical protein